MPPPRKHRHRCHGVFAPNHKLRPAVTSLAIGNVGKRQEAATGGHRGDGYATEGCCAATASPDWGELVQIHDDRAIFQASPDELPVIDIHSL